MYKKSIMSALLLLPLVLLPVEQTYAQEQVAKVRIKLKEALMGRSEKELSIMLGAPDKKKAKNADDEEIWFYGKSKVFLEKSHVVAFIDEGELIRRRASRPGTDKAIRKIRNNRRTGWRNIWTHVKGMSETEVIDSIVVD